MKGVRVYISGMGIISPLGNDLFETRDSIKNNRTGIRTLGLFPTAKNKALPVGEIVKPIETGSVPRTHMLTRIAAAQAMTHCQAPPDAIVMGITSGGMLSTETLLKEKEQNPSFYQYHSPGSVTEDIARKYRCTGPVITVSTACSSGAVAIKIALEMLRTGMAKQVLAGGADSLCRLTYHGFNSLQLIDPHGARPLDKDRKGMSVAEGAAMLLLVSDEPAGAVAEVLGAGLSCDAYHPTAPHPEGKGALAAMQAAIQDAGISSSDIDYVNLHGTGTLDNDLSEAKALNTLFAGKMPHLSSVKGAFGHSLAAAGAIEAVVSAISISEQLIPANTGCSNPDPEPNLDPICQPQKALISAVLSNSFGFGGNNASVLIGTPGKFGRASILASKCEPMTIIGSACISGAGNTKKTMENISDGQPCNGMLPIEELSKNLSPGKVRRLKRLPRLALSLAIAAHENSGRTDTPSAVFFGTGWGALSETFDFLTRLYETDEKFPSPTDFVGSVHNAPGGQIAMHFQSTGANVTTTGGDYSFEQSVMAAGLLQREINNTFLVLGADESSQELSPLFDRSILPGKGLSDGGGALCLARGGVTGDLTLKLSFYENKENNPEVIPSMVRTLGGPARIAGRYGAILVGIPGGLRDIGDQQLKTFLSLSGFENPVIDYRKLTGEFASASAVATVMAVWFMENRTIPARLLKGNDFSLDGKGVLVMGLGGFVTAMEVI
ncbi:MAG: 3-oxoacyl-ACP synthase [Desulfobacterales bacterium]|nr:3-oxoacyl-ACP synthase [Desulfobacterales bacterium]